MTFKATTQYQEFEGTVAIDDHGPVGIDTLCDDLGLDSDKFRPIGYSIYFEMDLGRSKRFEHIHLFLYDKKENKVLKARTDLDFKTLEKYVKRIDVNAFYSDGNTPGIIDNVDYQPKEIDVKELIES